MKLTGVILAGGWGTRMEKVCKEQPKAILKFDGVPFLVYLVGWLRKYCDEIIIAAGHNSAGISSIFGQEIWRMRNVMVVGEEIPLGTGGAIRLAATHSSNGIMFVCNGDTVVSDVDVAEIVGCHAMRNSAITAVLTKNEDTVQNRGAITVHAGRLIGFEEGKGDKKIYSYNASSTGCYVMNKEFVLKHFSERDGHLSREVSLERELLPLLVAKGAVDAYILPKNRLFLDFGNPSRFELLQEHSSVLWQIYGRIDGRG